MSLDTARFGEWFVNAYASDDNPRKWGMYVRTRARIGVMNPGVFYELTDCNGNFWEAPFENLKRAMPRASDAATTPPEAP